jgi:predicted MPP superfamily phosphohydrolase
MRSRLSAPLCLLGAASAGLAYAAGYEVRAFRLRRVEVPVLPAGQRPLRVLHLSDLHLTPDQDAKRRWVRALAALEPDLVVDTGDNLAHREAVPPVLDALGPLLERPGVFVRGSNDYYAPRPKNPAHYLLPGSGSRRTHGGWLPWRDLTDGLTAAGWTDLDNARATLTLDGRTLAFIGTDDPHIELDRYDEVAGPAAADADLTLGVTHAPYRRVIDAMAADGYALLLAGHTHGGQLRVPGVGALVTNCDLPRNRARGLSRWAAAARDPRTGVRHARPPAWLHVSAGLGTSPYAPVRFACPPEATLLTLVAP